MCQAFEPATSTQDKSLSTVGLPTRPIRRRAARGPLSVSTAARSLLSFSLSFSFLSSILSLSRSLSLSFSLFAFCASSLSPPPHPSSPPPLSFFLPSQLASSSLLPFFFFFFHYLPTNFPIRLPSYLRIKAVIVPRVYIYVYTRSLFPLFPSFRREVFLHASLFKATTFLLHPREARSFTRHPSSKCRAAVWRARERIEGR